MRHWSLTASVPGVRGVPPSSSTSKLSPASILTYIPPKNIVRLSLSNGKRSLGWGRGKWFGIALGQATFFIIIYLVSLATLKSPPTPPRPLPYPRPSLLQPLLECHPRLTDHYPLVISQTSHTPSRKYSGELHYSGPFGPTTHP